MNLMMLLEMAAGGFGDRTAIGSRDGTGLSYQEVFDAAGSAASQFAAADIENVALVDISSPALPVAMFGAAWAGKPFVPLNYRLTAAELRALSLEVAPSITICNADTDATLGEVSGVQKVGRGEFLDRAREAIVAACMQCCQATGRSGHRDRRRCDVHLEVRGGTGQAQPVGVHLSALVPRVGDLDVITSPGRCRELKVGVG